MFCILMKIIIKTGLNLIDLALKLINFSLEKKFEIIIELNIGIN